MFYLIIKLLHDFNEFLRYSTIYRAVEKVNSNTLKKPQVFAAGGCDVFDGIKFRLLLMGYSILSCSVPHAAHFPKVQMRKS